MIARRPRLLLAMTMSSLSVTCPSAYACRGAATCAVIDGIAAVNLAREARSSWQLVIHQLAGTLRVPHRAGI